jgi:hypothetical protein
MHLSQVNNKWMHRVFQIGQINNAIEPITSKNKHLEFPLLYKRDLSSVWMIYTYYFTFI